MANRFKGRDFLTIRSECIEFLKEKLGDKWNDVGEADGLIGLVEAIAYLGDNLHYYIDMQKREADLVTATLLKDVYQKATRDGYRPYLNHAAYVNLYLTVTAPYSGTIIFPRGTVFQTVDAMADDDNVMFTLLDEYKIENYVADSEASLMVKVHQGLIKNEYKEQSDISQFGYIKLATSQAAEGYMKVKVGTQEFKQVDDVFTSFETGKVFSTYLLFLRSTQNQVVQFAYDYQSWMTSGDSIEIEYLECDGAKGNVSTGRITQCTTPVGVYDSSNVQLGNAIVQVEQRSDAIGGTDYESIASIRANYNTSIRNLDTLVTLEDYEAYATFFLGAECVAIDVSTYAPTGDPADSEQWITDARTVWIFVPNDTPNIDITHLYEELELRKGRGDIFEIKFFVNSSNTIQRSYNITASVLRRDTTESDESIISSIESAIASEYRDTKLKGVPVYVSRLYSLIQGASDSIVSVTLTSPTQDIVPKEWEVSSYTLSVTITNPQS